MGQTVQQRQSKLLERIHALESAKTGELAERINPRNFNFSPMMSAIVGAIIGFDFGVRDRKGGKLSAPISITSDGFVTCHSTASDGGGAFIGSIDDLELNLNKLKEYLNEEGDKTELDRRFKANVMDWRAR